MAEFLASRARDILGECTEAWAKHPVDPLEGVALFQHKMGAAAHDYTTYLSTAVTAGGYIRDTSLPIPQVIQRNTEAALLYADLLHNAKLINLQTSIDAVSIGYIPGWGQNGYMEFWLTVMSRIDLSATNMHHIRSAMNTFAAQHDMQLFNDSKAPHNLRRPLYHAFEQTFVTATRNMSKQPIRQSIQLIDTNLSLGGEVEALYAKHENIAVAAPQYGGSVDQFLTWVADSDPANHFSRLRQLGAHIIHTSHTPGLSLQPVSE